MTDPALLAVLTRIAVAVERLADQHIVDTDRHADLLEAIEGDLGVAPFTASGLLQLASDYPHGALAAAVSALIAWISRMPPSPLGAYWRDCHKWKSPGSSRLPVVPAAGVSPQPRKPRSAAHYIDASTCTAKENSMDATTSATLKLNEALQHQRAGRLLAAEAARELDLAELKRAESRGHRFSIVRAIKAMSAEGGGGLLDGFEFERCQQNARDAGVSFDPNRIIVRWGDLQGRTMVTGTATSGGYLVSHPAVL